MVILFGMTHRVGPKGQVVIPKELRDDLGILPGDLVEFWREGDHVIVRRAVPQEPLFGRFRGAGLAELLAALHERLGQVRHAPHLLLADYRAASATLGREVEVTLPGQRRILGRAVDIDDGGGRVVEDSDGNRQLVTAGDVIHATI